MSVEDGRCGMIIEVDLFGDGIPSSRNTYIGLWWTSIHHGKTISNDQRLLYSTDSQMKTRSRGSVSTFNGAS